MRAARRRLRGAARLRAARDTSSTSGPFLDDFETFVTSFVGLFDDNVGAADGPRIAIASYADAVRDMLLGGATLSYGTKAEILAAVGPWLQVDKDDHANNESRRRAT